MEPPGLDPFELRRNIILVCTGATGAACPGEPAQRALGSRGQVSSGSKRLLQEGGVWAAPRTRIPWIPGPRLPGNLLRSAVAGIGAAERILKPAHLGPRW